MMVADSVSLAFEVMWLVSSDRIFSKGRMVHCGNFARASSTPEVTISIRK